MTAPTPQATGPRHPFETLFAQLTGAMSKRGAPVVHELAPTPARVPSRPGRVVWTIRNAAPVGLAGKGGRSYRKQGADFVGFLEVVFDVEMHAPNPLELTNKLAELTGWLDMLVGPKQGASDAGDGYDVGRSSAFEVGDGTTVGCFCTVPVTLYAPTIYSQIWGRRVVASVTVNVLALKDLDDVPDGDPLNPIQAAA